MTPTRAQRAEGSPEAARRVCVVGADGLLGGGLAAALGAERVVYRAPRPGEVHVGACEPVLRRADVVVTSHGFRITPGCAEAAYRASHLAATAALVPFLRRGALLVHVSSSAVLGTGVGLGNATPPAPDRYPAPAYARAKLETDRYLARAAEEGGFRVVFLRPATVYAAGAAGMIDTLLRLARRGIALRLYPRRARHHLVHVDLLGEVARRVIAREDLPSGTALVVAEPAPVTNEELEALVRPALPPRHLVLPLPVPLLAALRHGPHARDPRLDLATRGEIFGVLAMDTVYDPSETFRVLGIDPSDWSPARTLLPVVEEALRA